MTTPGTKRTEKAVELACQFDDQLRAEYSSINGLNLEGKDSDDDSSAGMSGLSVVERSELEQAKAAVWFLNRVRNELDQGVTRVSKTSVAASNDSTLNGVVGRNMHRQGYRL